MSFEEKCFIDKKGTPLDFKVILSTEEKLFDFDKELCPLCSKASKIFYCKACVQNGNFVHSTSKRIERFADKKLKFLSCEREKNNLIKLCEIQLQNKLLLARLNSENQIYKERTQYLTLFIKEKKDNISKYKEQKAILEKSNKDKIERLSRYRGRVKKLVEYVKDKKKDIDKRRNIHNDSKKKLSGVIQRRVKELVEYIFPISIIQPSFHQSCSSDDEISDTIVALAEASRTAYINGKWVLTDSSSELQHCIVAPTLPSSGDYSAYNDWVLSNKDAVPGSTNDSVERNPAYTISSALCYTAQLVNILAFYLDTRLPTKVSFSDFCGTELSEEKFARRVSRLNWNIMHLCLSQKVQRHLLNSKNTLQNILYLVDDSTSELGRIGLCDVDTEDETNQDLSNLAIDYCSDSDDSSDDDQLPCEWENIATLSLPEMLPRNYNYYNQPSQHISSSSVAGGLVSTAAASIASLWKGWKS